MAAEKEAARIMAEKEQQRLAAEKEAARLKAEEEQRRMAAEKIAIKQRREQLVADTFVAAVQKIPRGARPAWKTSASQADVLAALARTLPLCAEKWKIINETKGDELVQQTFTGVGFLSSNQRALIQSAQMEGYTDVRMTLWFDNGKGLLGTVSPEGAGLIPETNGYLAEAFRKILEKEIGKPLK
ncbi:MAG: hypothetical protein EBS05_26490 [Proteobacteria bacterium]|nr:hypothetical protein [Pseudomonadota bacterium]